MTEGGTCFARGRLPAEETKEVNDAPLHFYLHKKHREPVRSALGQILAAIELSLEQRSSLDKRASLGKLLARVS